MRVTLDRFESIGQEYARKLAEMGIETYSDFSRFSLDEVKKATGIEDARIEQWRDVLDLYRVPGISARDAELLVAINVNSVEELAHRQAVRIFYKLKEIDESSYLIVIDLPSFRVIDSWIHYARLLSKRIKFGLSIPLIKLPMVSIEDAIEFQKFQVVTAEELLIKEEAYGNLRKKIGLSKKKWQELHDFISLLRVDGIDVLLATILTRAGIPTLRELVSLDSRVVATRAEAVRLQIHEGIEEITPSLVEVWKDAAISAGLVSRDETMDMRDEKASEGEEGTGGAAGDNVAGTPGENAPEDLEGDQAGDGPGDDKTQGGDP